MKSNKRITKFKGFMDGYRVIMVVDRTKNKRTKKKISTNKEEFIKIFNKLKEQKNIGERTYSSVNKRDIEGAIRTFKHNQLDADYYNDSNRHRFYLDVKNRFVSALMKQYNKLDSYFLIDIDKNEGDSLGTTLKLLRKELCTNINKPNYYETLDDLILLEYKTKNGFHLITHPFNTGRLPDLEIKKDSMLLLDY